MARNAQAFSVAPRWRMCQGRTASLFLFLILLGFLGFLALLALLYLFGFLALLILLVFF